LPESAFKTAQFIKHGFKIQPLFKLLNGAIAGRSVLEPGAIKIIPAAITFAAFNAVYV